MITCTHTSAQHVGQLVDWGISAVGHVTSHPQGSVQGKPCCNCFNANGSGSWRNVIHGFQLGACRP